MKLSFQNPYVHIDLMVLAQKVDNGIVPGIATAAWLAQLVERRTAVREVEGSSPRLDQHSGS